MNLQTLPDGQLTQRFKLAREAAEKLGHADRFAKTPLAVTFSPEWNYQLPDPFTPQHSQHPHQRAGAAAGHLHPPGQLRHRLRRPGEEHARSQLHPARRAARRRSPAAAHRQHHRAVERRLQGGVRSDRSRPPGPRLGDAPTRVLVAAGSLGSTELLLRCRDEHRTLPGLSRLLGRNWSANANLLSTAVYSRRRPRPADARPEHLERDRLHRRQPGRRALRDRRRRLPEPDSELAARVPRRRRARPGSGAALLQQIEEHVRADPNLRNVMVWLGAGMDAGDGQLSLKRRLFAPWVRDLDLQWTPQNSKGVIEAILDVHRKMTAATGGPAARGTAREYLQQHGDAASARRVPDGRQRRTTASSIIWGRCSATRGCTSSTARLRRRRRGGTRRTRSRRWPSASRRTSAKRFGVLGSGAGFEVPVLGSRFGGVVQKLRVIGAVGAPLLCGLLAVSCAEAPRELGAGPIAEQGGSQGAARSSARNIRCRTKRRTSRRSRISSPA